MLQSELGLGLSDAKKTTDRVMDKELIELHVGSHDYERIEQLATGLGAIVLDEKTEATCK
jgi:hypothetical protein